MKINQITQKAKRNTYNLPRQQLNFKKLNRKALKITHPGTGKNNQTEHNNHPWSFSIITPTNAAWNHWEIKPESEKYVQETDWLNGKQANGNPNLDDEKYQQIIKAAKRLKLL